MVAFKEPNDLLVRPRATLRCRRAAIGARIARMAGGATVEPEPEFGALRLPPFSAAIDAFEDLMAQSGRAFLLGAGSSRCAGLPLTAELTDRILADEQLTPSAKEILGDLKAGFDGSGGANIEDYLSELIDLLAIADRRILRGATEVEMSLGSKCHSADVLRDAATSVKDAIGRAVGQQVSIETHRRFVRAVHRPLRPGKPPGGGPIDYLVLNYDTLLEDALALERLAYADGIDGGATGWWNLATFDRQDLAARVLKLHGSIDWREVDHPDMASIDQVPRDSVRPICPTHRAGKATVAPARRQSEGSSGMRV